MVKSDGLTFDLEPAHIVTVFEWVEKTLKATILITKVS